jgi:putative flavoprotein involved in K+ transport
MYATGTSQSPKDEPMSERIEILVIGAGQAGLSISYYLTQHGRDHLILEQASSIVPTWRKRWDSFTLVLPNWTVKMPGMPVPEDVADGFFTREELVAHFDQFAATFEPEIRFDTQVTSVEQNPPNSNYLVHTNQGAIEANHVVVAAGTFQHPRIPAFSENISPDIVQLHTDDYRNPEELPDGAVLVVGSAQSGCQIAEELYTSGRKVYLSVGGAPRFPRDYRGEDTIWWLDEVGFFDAHVTTLESSRMRFAANPVATGKNGGGNLNLHQFYRDGVTLLGRGEGAQDNVMSFAPDLIDNLTKSDEFVAQMKKNIDAFIAEHDIDAPAATPGSPLRDGYDAEIIEQLDLSEAGITTIIWGTGYKFDYGWIKLPIHDQDGFPIQQRGVSEFPGLYFIGLLFMNTRRSGLLSGVAADAEYLAERIAFKS